MGGWNFADAWEAITDSLPEDALAQVHGGRSFTWGEFDRRADGIAATLTSAALPRQARVAQYLYNSPEYLDAVYGTFKASMVPVNTNSRYTDDELVSLWDDASVEAVVFHGTFVPVIGRIRDRVAGVRVWLWVDDGTGACPEWAIDFEEAARSASSRFVPGETRSGDDLLLLYTGGTTGKPKGVVWRQDDLLMVLDRTTRPSARLPEQVSIEHLLDRMRKRPVSCPVSPLMHGTAILNALGTLMAGGTVVTLRSRSLDVIELLDEIARNRIGGIAIVGDVYAKPLLQALDAESDRWDISSLRVVASGGMMWSSRTKEGLLRHNPGLILVDTLGASEAIGVGSSVMTADSGGMGTGRFQLSGGARVLDADGTDVVPGSGQPGMLALGGRLPVGYLGDDTKTQATFRIIDGVRYVIPGDWAEVHADGSVRLIGRATSCINTGGEKVFPEEVEEVVKSVAGVADAAVVGTPDERFGELVTALVELAPGFDVQDGAIVEAVRQHLAGYKAPRRILRVPAITRTQAGKVDHETMRAEAFRILGLDALEPLEPA